MKKILKSSQGSAIMTALVLTAVVFMVSAALLSSISGMKFYKPDIISFGLAAEIAQKQVVTILESEASWTQTKINNPNMACLNDSVTNCPNVFQDFVLYLPNGTIFTQNNGTQGFTKRGYYCQTYDPAAGDMSCITKIKLQWRCLDTPCTSAVSKSTRVSVQLTYFRSLANDAVAVERAVPSLNALVLRGNVSGSIKASCEAMGGRLEEGGTHCRIFPVNDLNCVATAGRHMVDRIQGGNVVCTNPTGYGDGTNPFKCNAGSAVTGYISDHPACDVF